jgi:hypothetical protein
MQNDVEGRRRDDEMRQRHEQAVAAGEKRVLSRTMEGRLYSYARDEIGFARAGSGPIVTSAVGMLVLAVVFAAFTVLSVWLIAAPTSQGQDPLWGALFLTLGGFAGVIYASRLAVAEIRAKRVRRERGIPEPSPRQLN